VADEASKEASKSSSPFDVRTIKSLVALMTQHDLSEIDLRDGMQRLRLRRGSAQTLVATTSVPMMSQMAQPMPSGNNASTPPETGATSAPTRKLLEIKSPTVGTFYASPSPDAQAFVKVGSKVTPTTVVCLVEAMKLFNEITADCTGTVAEILVENQQSVEYGQVLFRVDPAG
jgi:acetyl-CoA carboxylase biotin carboxyl carrier protein